MRFLIPLFFALRVSAQLPVLAVAPNASSGNPDYKATLYVDLETDTTASLGAAYSQGNIVTWWTNIAPFNPNVTLAIYSATTSSGVWPTYNASQTPTGKAAIQFSANNGTATQPIITAVGSNQPNTVLYIMKANGANTESTIDCPSGSRTLLKNSPTGSLDWQIFCGSVVTTGGNQMPQGNIWFLATFVLNGANSYVRTNGVLCQTFSPGANGIGQIKFGNDNTLATAFKGQLAAVRIYQEAIGTNNLHTAEQNLATRYLGITLPHP